MSNVISSALAANNFGDHFRFRRAEIATHCLCLHQQRQRAFRLAMLRQNLNNTLRNRAAPAPGVGSAARRTRRRRRSTRQHEGDGRVAGQFIKAVRGARGLAQRVEGGRGRLDNALVAHAPVGGAARERTSRFRVDAQPFRRGIRRYPSGSVADLHADDRLARYEPERQSRRERGARSRRVCKLGRDQLAARSQNRLRKRRPLSFPRTQYVCQFVAGYMNATPSAFSTSLRWACRLPARSLR